MTRFNILLVILFVFAAACVERPSSGEETSPGPVTEADKQRYNLNPSDEMLYDPMDSLAVDTLMEDTLLRRE